MIDAGEMHLKLLVLLPLVSLVAAVMAGIVILWPLTAISPARAWTLIGVVVLVGGTVTVAAARQANAVGAAGREHLEQAQAAWAHVRKVDGWLDEQVRPLIQHGQEFLSAHNSSVARGPEPAAPGTSGNRYKTLTVALECLVDDTQRVLEWEAEMGQSRVTLYMTRRLHSMVRPALDKQYELARKIEDPETLDLAFDVDQLITQMRRSIESLAILGGHRPRKQEQTSLVTTLLRSAVSEVKNDGRVRREPLPDSAILGYAVPDLVHLLAELVENAVRYSPPTTEVRVTPSYVPAGLAVEIDDVGLPMNAEKLETLNRLLADPEAPGIHADLKSSGLGMRVVAKIARHYEITVHLGRNRKGGNQALVIIPTKLLIAAQAEEPAAVDPAGVSQTDPPVAPPRAAAPWPAGPPAAVAAAASETPRMKATKRLPRRVRQGGDNPPLPRRSQTARTPLPDPESATRPSSPPPPAVQPGRFAAQFARGLRGTPPDGASATDTQNTDPEETGHE